MTRPLVEALHRRPLSRPPVWVMRQAGRYLPEYREVRSRYGFQEAVSTPAVAAELSLQPIRRFGMDGAVIFADIMTPLEAMGVDMTFDPGPRLRPHDLGEVIALGELDEARVGFVAETVRLVRDRVPDEVAVIGFAGAPFTLLAYLLEGGGSKEFLAVRRALWEDPSAAMEALSVLARAMGRYLRMQVDAGADAVQLFDSWVGMLSRDHLDRYALAAARAALAGIPAPTIYFGPHAHHALDLLPVVGATAYGLDWRLRLDEAWGRLGDVAVQGNLDPAVLLAPEDTIRRAVADLLEQTGGRPGHVVNLGHGIDPSTPPEHVSVLVEAVRGTGT
ncbi:MAG: uroporphyrinogen decarboxylase [Acidimicrobiia bacterium]|jgi:uroporphyrinogen decarboxylase